MKYGATFRLFAKGYSKYKLQIFILLLLGFLGAFLEGIGVSTLIPLLSRFTEDTATSDLFSKLLGKALSSIDFGFAFKALLLIIIFAFILKAIVLFAAKYLATRISEDYEKETRGALLSNTLSANWPFLTGQKLGYLETILIKDIDASKRLLFLLSTLCLNISTFLIYSIMAMIISPAITLISLTLGGLIFLLTKSFLYKTKELSKQSATAASDMIHHVSENIVGIKTIKSSSMEEIISKIADNFFTTLRNTNLKLSLLGEIPVAIVEPIGVGFIVSIFAFLYLTDNFQLGVFAATIYLIHRIFTSMQNIQTVLYKVHASIPYLQRIVETREGAFRNKEGGGGNEHFAFDKLCEFHNICFAYDRSTEVLKNFNLKVKRGEMVGIIGESGAGKTTLVDMLLRLINPSRGEIFVDGKNISRINLKDWRRNVGYVSQDIFVLNDSIENNIKFYSGTINVEDIQKASKMAYFYDFVQSLPEQFKTKVGERGILLSGGEKQRLILARVLARNPQILILDEATSALDNKSELMIQRAVEELRERVTIFVIAHRLSTVLNCDKVIFLQNGAIQEEGPPRELLKNRKTSFYKLYNIRGGITPR